MANNKKKVKVETNRLAISLTNPINNLLLCSFDIHKKIIESIESRIPIIDRTLKMVIIA